MMNFDFYKGSCFNAFTDAVDRKAAGVAQDAIRAEYQTIEPKFDTYSDLFARNELEFLIQDNAHTHIRTELLSLYGSDNVVVNGIRAEVQILQNRSIRYKCPYCTLESANTMDHIVAKDQFPEFAIHAKNLIPSCGTCNSYKGDRWRIGTKKNTINFYLDQLPNIRYLMVDVVLDKYDEIDFKFRLFYTPGMNYDTYKLILSHFAALHLRKRMTKAAIADFGEFHREIKIRFKRGETRQSLTATTLEACVEDRKALGLNHWKPAIKEALVNSEYFWNSL